MEVDEGCPVTRDNIIAALHAENILARKYFWPGTHKMQPYRNLFPHAGLVLPQTIQIAERVIVLPSGATTTSEQVRTVCDIIKKTVLS